ncbi:MAG TPA: ISL3 family transposase [Gammaproteobacteria bacterium]|nr:ISL3 family transposase [Gammaproteobacteria bacterium]
MPQRDFILNLPGFTIKKVSGYNPLILDIHYRRQARCVHCNGKNLRKKSSYIRKVRHETVGHRPMVLRFTAHKFYCRPCKRYFNQQFPGIGKHQRSTERLKFEIYHQHTEGVSAKSLAKTYHLGKATLERWYHQRYKLEHQERLQQQCPMVLGIDEHFFSKKQGFATTLCDLRHHRIFDVVKGKSAQDLKSYLSQLKGKERVRVICIDLSSSYRQLIRQYFPNALVVADRFHVVRLLNHMCLQTYQSIDVEMKYQRGLLAALRTKPENLCEKRKKKRDEYLEQQPAIKAIYDFKQQLHELLMYKHRKARQCKHLIPLFLERIKELKQSPFKPLRTLGKTLYQWREEVVRMWRFTKNNGITEGFHRKMKLIQRRAYGFKNFENYRLRVRVLCG